MVALEFSVTCMLLTCMYSFLIYRLTNRFFLKIKKVFIFSSSLFAGKNLDKGILQEQFLSSVVQRVEKN